MAKLRNVEVAKEEGLSYGAVRSTPKQADTLAIVQQMLIGMAGASALMGIGAYMALTVMK